MNTGIVALIFSFGYLLYIGGGVRGDCSGFDLTLTNKGDRTEYVEVTSKIPDLEQFSICASLTTDNNGLISGTVGSYSTKDEVDVLLAEGEMTKSGLSFKIGVNGDIKVILSPLMKNKEYHFCIDFNLPKNKVSTFINGKPVSVLTFDNAGSIPGGGKLIIGQRQGCYGGCFNKSRAFNGRIRNFVLTKTTVTEAERKQIAMDNICPEDVIKLEPQNTIPHFTLADCPNAQYTLENTAKKVQYIEITLPVPKMTYFTTCVSVKSDKKGKIPGTVGSYATENEHDLIALVGEIGPEGPLIRGIVNQQERVLVSQLAPETEYSFCMVYQLPKNYALLYVNGVFQFKLDYNEMGSISGGGTVIIGQKQGCHKGCFEKVKAYNGLMRNFMMWNRALSDSEIKAISQTNKCPGDAFIDFFPKNVIKHGGVE